MLAGMLVVSQKLNSNTKSSKTSESLPCREKLLAVLLSPVAMLLRPRAPVQILRISLPDVLLPVFDRNTACLCRKTVPSARRLYVPAARLGSSSTAEQALRGLDLTGTTTLITGANSGIGAETARVMANAGARVIMTSRDAAAGEAAAAAIRQQGAKGQVIVKHLDLADLRTVRALAEEVREDGGRLDRLILNAGVMACPLSYTRQGFEVQMGTNHFGHFLLTTMLLPKLQAQSHPSRIVSLSSAAHIIVPGLDFQDMHWRQKGYQTWVAYAQSKLANLLMVKELSQRLQGSQVLAYSVHPGVVATNLARHIFSAQMPAWLIPFVPFIKSAQQGAATSVYAATAPELSGQSGAYLDNCTIARPSQAGQDLHLASRLWQSTEEQIERALRLQQRA